MVPTRLAIQSPLKSDERIRAYSEQAWLYGYLDGMIRALDHTSAKRIDKGSVRLCSQRAQRQVSSVMDILSGNAPTQKATLHE